MSGQEGIDRLLQAEQDATEIVAKARKEKAARIKQARDEAEAEVKQYRSKLEQQFQESQSMAMGGSDKSVALAVETEKGLSDITRLAESNRVKVVREILTWVSSVDTTPPVA
ncbi:vacuolar ATPase [Baffinella frigidus]|nr:vacuolar ATPase [Cryptophyta sp. CCMP2293]|mmetsp:Transcript_34710/g.81155  ORF Transcript_34710/g.81155 Transcript_34710/m.81155 type:complete len:112 (-) Transcript_34710:196-531(-)